MVGCVPHEERCVGQTIEQYQLLGEPDVISADRAIQRSALGGLTPPGMIVIWINIGVEDVIAQCVGASASQATRLSTQT